MGIPGHYVLRVDRCLLPQGGNGVFHKADRLVDPAPEIQPQVGGHLIVPAPRGMKALARVADAFGKLHLNEGMDILRRHVDCKRAGFDVGVNALQPALDGLGVLRGDDPLCSQHGGMGKGAGDILPPHTAVKADGGV